MALNINREVEDAFYRYKMPRLVAKVEGKGNGIKTVIPNMGDIAKSLNRPPSYPTKYFGIELGAQTIMQTEADRYIVNGAHEAGKLQDLLDGFIKKFVLCANCTNPETELRVTSKKQIEQSCTACGHHGYIPLSHKLTTFIVNNPPNQPIKGSKKDQSEKKAKGDKKGATAAADAEKDSLTPVAAAARDNVATRRTGGDIAAPDAEINPDGEVEWSVDTSEDAVRARAAGLGGAANLTHSDDLERSENDRLQLFDQFVSARLGQKTFPAKEVLAEADRLDVKERGVMVLVDRLWTGDVIARTKLFQAIFQRFTHDNEKAQRNMLHAVEAMVAKDTTLMVKLPAIFQLLYETDIVEEQSFLAWAEKPSKKYAGKDLMEQIHQKVAPFIQWLRDAEEEDDDEDDDDAVDVVYESSAPSNGLGVAKVTAANGDGKAAATAAAAAPPAAEDDVDIDAI